MGVQLLEGRWLRDDDMAADRDTAIVNDIAAARLWPGQDALGQTLLPLLGRQCRQYGNEWSEWSKPCAIPDWMNPIGAGSLLRVQRARARAVPGGSNRPALGRTCEIRAHGRSLGRSETTSLPEREHVAPHWRLRRRPSFHNDAARHHRLSGAAARRGRRLRRDLVRNLASHSGDRRPHGPRRHAAQCAVADLPSRHAAGRRRRSDRAGLGAAPRSASSAWHPPDACWSLIALAVASG